MSRQSTLYDVIDTDHFDSLDTLGELVSDLAQWLLASGLEQWSRDCMADAIGESARRLMVQSITHGTTSGATSNHCASVTSLDFMFVQQT